MSDTVTQDVVVEDIVEKTEQPEEDTMLEPLIEEVSIDGMCGVY